MSTFPSSFTSPGILPLFRILPPSASPTVTESTRIPQQIVSNSNHLFFGLLFRSFLFSVVFIRLHLIFLHRHGQSAEICDGNFTVLFQYNIFVLNLSINFENKTKNLNFVFSKKPLTNAETCGRMLTKKKQSLRSHLSTSVRRVR